jgi:uncharacterized membrane protein YidH (DUF202 family)
VSTGIGPSDPGLAGERTSLAWTRIGLSLLAVPAGLVAYAVGRDQALTLVLAAGALVAGLAVLVLSLRRPRAPAGMVERGEALVGARLVLTTGATVLLVDAAGIVLVLLH